MEITTTASIGDNLTLVGTRITITGTVIDVDDAGTTALIDVWGAGASIGLYLPDWIVYRTPGVQP